MIVRNIPTLDPGVVTRLAGFGVATIHEAQGRTGLLQPELRPIYPGARVTGRALTVLIPPGDNLMVHAAIEQLRQGDILVVASTSPNTDGIFGELLATSVAAHGGIGLITNTGVRDVAALTQIGFPVWARAACAQGTTKASPGSVNVPIVIAGMRVVPGDVISADDDGVVVIPRDDADAVAKAAQRREEEEDKKRQRLASGELGLDMYGLRATLDRLGVTYVDSLEWTSGE